MIFNSFDFNLHKKINLHFIFMLFIIYCSLNLTSIPYYIPFFYPLHFLTFYFFVNTEVGLKFWRKIHLLDVIANMLLKSSTKFRSLNMHLYQSNFNLKIDICCLYPICIYRIVLIPDIFGCSAICYI